MLFCRRLAVVDKCNGDVTSTDWGFVAIGIKEKFHDQSQKVESLFQLVSPFRCCREVELSAPSGFMPMLEL